MTACSHFAEQPHSGNSDRGPRSLPSIPVRVYAPFHAKVNEPSGRECTHRLASQPPTLCSRSFSEPCPERSDRGPHALPSFSRRDLRDSNHEGRRPSERVTFPIGSSSELSVQTGGPQLPTLCSRSFSKPCPGRSDRSPNALPSFSRRDLHDPDPEGRRPSG